MLPRNKHLKTFSSELRNNATKQEKHLWYDFLRKYHIHFYRQYIIGNYITDFYCPKAKIIIEVDGSQHFNEDNHMCDNERTKFLNSLGLVVLRFTNRDVDFDFNSVCEFIDAAIKNRIDNPQSSNDDSSFEKGAR